ncbi:MAG: two-component regulator propeller domain-containing protein [Ignavibacteriaceae bacterium]|nr:two-component regulator propeller domain-containing protein [Ignavibacteriaceae bacterium]
MELSIMRIHVKRIFFFGLLLCVFSFAQQKEIHFEHLVVEDGLSSNTICYMLQDSRGFLWVGTYDEFYLINMMVIIFLFTRNSTDDTSSISDNEDKKLYPKIILATSGLVPGAGDLINLFRDTEKFIQIPSQSRINQEQ